MDAGVETQVVANLLRGIGGDPLRNLALGVVQVAKQHGTAAGIRAGLHAGRLAVAVDAVNTKRTTLYRSLATWRVGFLVFQRLVDKLARLVRTGHHAVTAADTGMLVDQNDTVCAFERGAGRADIHAGRLFAVLAHHR